MSITLTNPGMAAVKAFIEEELLNARKQGFDENTDLIEQHVIDSIGLLRLITCIEENCQIQVPDEDMVAENFRSLAAIQTFVDRRQGCSEPREKAK
jgi:acyl carrier protein